jgi:hypothetical protein
VTSPTTVELSVAGLLNGLQFGGQGSLTVDTAEGTKTGTITYDPLPPGLTAGPDCMVVSTGKCFVGAKPTEGRGFVGPLDLLGRKFKSMRSTSVGRFGTFSISETGSYKGGVLRSDLTGVGTSRVRRVRGLGPLREVIKVTGPNTMVGEGRYTLLVGTRGSIPVRYTHFYRALRPDRKLFRRMRGRKFLLRAIISTKIRGRRLIYRSRSTIRYMK